MTNKTVFISGATSGFGEAMAKQFAAAGFKVIATGRRAEKLLALATYISSTYNNQIHTIAFDIRDKAACFAAIENLPEPFKQIDILINNAGGAWGKDAVQDALIEDWEIMIDTNLKGLMYLTKAVLPQMMDRKQGHIINVGSIAGKEVYQNGNGYNAAKFAVDAFSKSLRIDLLPFNIKVTHIAPGAAETAFSMVRFKGDAEKAAAVYAGYQALKAEDVADVIFYTANLPAHVCINDLVITPTAQANSFYLHRES